MKTILFILAIILFASCSKLEYHTIKYTIEVDNASLEYAPGRKDPPKDEFIQYTTKVSETVTFANDRVFRLYYNYVCHPDQQAYIKIQVYLDGELVGEEIYNDRRCFSKSSFFRVSSY